MPEDKKTNDIFGVVLAAGSATRFGATKQLADLDGVPLVQRATGTAAEACGDRTLLVLGHDWRAVADACDPLRGFMVVNDDYAAGLGTSIACAVRAVQHVADAVVLLLADQPLISAAHVRSLCSTWSGAADEIVATSYAETVGVPALFGRACFGELASLGGDTGAKQVIASGRFEVQSVAFEPAAADIDTPEDLAKL